jgi:hypothetical protein
MRKSGATARSRLRIHAQNAVQEEFIMRIRILALMGLACIVVLAGACCPWFETGTVRTESRSQELGGAQSASVDIRMGAGKLVMGAGASGIMDADFSYTISSWKPEVSYRVSDGRGYLTVEQPSVGNISLGRNERYEWNVRLNGSVPIDLQVSLGAGESQLDLRDLKVNELQITTGAGNTKIDLPARSLTRLEMNAGVGDANLNLLGEWKNNLKATVRAGIGAITLRLPHETGVKVKVTGALGKVNANGFRVQDDAYVNDAYGRSAVTLDISVAGAVGSVTLELGD